MAWQFTSRAPVYMQIVSRLRADILNGVYRSDEQIPAVRQLAINAGVNPNTMQRAFAVLEAEHLFVTRGTVGRFITTDERVLAEARETVHREMVARIVEEAASIGLTPAALVERLLPYAQASEADSGVSPEGSHTARPSPSHDAAHPLSPEEPCASSQDLRKENESI